VSSVQQMVKTYKFGFRRFFVFPVATQAYWFFMKDANQLAQQGWHVASQSSTESAFNPARITVTYQKI
jgi:hypothetical protein